MKKLTIGRVSTLTQQVENEGIPIKTIVIAILWNDDFVLLIITLKHQHIQSLNMSQQRKLKSVLLLLCVLVCAQQREWQGTGNMSSSNMTTIWNYITANIQRDLDNFSLGLSNYLNQQWDPAWNVFSINGQAGTDTVVYGYAFNNHWFWFNDWMGPNAFLQNLGFIIWKDYNCHTWQSIGFGTQGHAESTFTATEKDSFKSIISSFTIESVSNIWLLAVALSQASNAVTGYETSAFTAVASQGQSYFFGRVCIVNANYYSTAEYGGDLFDNGQANSTGRFYILQMR